LHKLSRCFWLCAYGIGCFRAYYHHKRNRHFAKLPTNIKCKFFVAVRDGLSKKTPRPIITGAAAISVVAVAFLCYTNIKMYMHDGRG